MTIPPGIAAVLSGASRWCVITSRNEPILEALGDAAVDVVLCDPPYDERTHAHARTMRRPTPGTTWADRVAGTGGLAGRAMDIDFGACNPAEVAPALVRAARRWALAFCALEHAGKYADAAGDAWVRCGVWHRIDGAPQFTGDRPAQACDGIAIMHRAGRKRWNGGGARGFWSHATVHARLGRADSGRGIEARVHPTQKPVELMAELVELFTDPGEVILDPFCGSGTTGVACLRLGRRFIGIEQSEPYADVARERMRAEEAGSTLSAARAGQLSMFGDRNG